MRKPDTAAKKPFFRAETVVVNGNGGQKHF